MATLGVSYDPDFYSSKARMAGEALRAISGSFARRREEREAKELDEISRFFEAVQSVPELANTWGEDLKARLGEKHPGVPEMVDAIKGRYAIAEGVKRQRDQAQQAWLNQWGQLDQGYAQQAEMVRGMPQTLPPPVAGSSPFSLLPEMPNMGRVAAEQELNQTDPRYFARKALEQLPPEQQWFAAQAIGGNKSFEMPTPMTIFDPYRNLPAEQQALRAGLEGKTSPEELLGSRVKLGLLQSPARQAFQKHETVEREARESHDVETAEADRAWRDKDRERRDAQMKKRLYLQDSLAQARDARRLAQSKELTDYRAEKTGEAGGVSWQSLVADSETTKEAWDKGLREAMANPAGTKAQAKKQYIQEHGTQPRVLGETQARRIARTMNQRVKDNLMTLDEAEDEAIGIAADFMGGEEIGAAMVSRETSTRQAGAVDATAQFRAEARAVIEAKIRKGELPEDFDIDQAVEDALFEYAGQYGGGE